MGIKTALGAIKAFGSRHSTAITVGLSIVGYACCIATTISETRTFDARIEELKNAGKAYTSFSGVKEGMESSVKFIYRADSI
jgi:hypothetical protein